MSGSSEFGKVAAATGRVAADVGRNGITLRISPEHIGYATAALVTFLGVTIIGPGIARLLHPRRPSIAKRARRKGRHLRTRAELAALRGERHARHFADKVRS